MSAPPTASPSVPSSKNVWDHLAGDRSAYARKAVAGAGQPPGGAGGEHGDLADTHCGNVSPVSP